MQARKRFYFEKKKQKTFANWPPGAPMSGGLEQKFFAALFFKKARTFRPRSAADKTCLNTPHAPMWRVHKSVMGPVYGFTTSGKTGRGASGDRATRPGGFFRGVSGHMVRGCAEFSLPQPDPCRPRRRPPRVAARFSKSLVPPRRVCLKDGTKHVRQVFS
jgi:hypothetical protein